MAFDILTDAKKLQEAGVPAAQAEAHAGALKELVEDNFATKRDLKELEVALRSDIKELETALRCDIKEMEPTLLSEIELVRQDMQMMRRDIVIWLGGLIIVATTALGVLMKLR